MLMPVYLPGDVERSDFGKSFSVPSEKIITSHIPWAKPYEKKIKALIICPRMSMREVIELAQRLSLDYATVCTESSEQIGRSGFVKNTQRVKGSYENEILEDLYVKLKSGYDVIILGNFNWDKLPDKAKLLILQKVKTEGTGLLFSSPRAKSSLFHAVLKNRVSAEGNFLLSSAFPWDYLPAYEHTDPRKMFETAQFGKGRVLNFGSQVRIRNSRWHLSPFISPDKTTLDEPQINYDYYLQPALKAILWAARKEPLIFVSGLSWSPEKPDSVNIAVTNRKQTQKTVLCLTLRNLDGTILSYKEIAAVLNPGENKLTVKAERIPGDVFVDVRIKNPDGKILGWGSQVMNLSGKAKISVELPKKSFSRNEKVRGNIRITGLPGRITKLNVSIEDNYGRIIATENIQFPGHGDNAVFEFAPPFDYVTMRQKVKVSLENKAVFSVGKEFFINDLPCTPDDIFVFAWGPLENNFLSPLLLRQLKQYGLDAMIWKAYFCPVAARENMLICPFAAITMKDTAEQKLKNIRTPCLTDPGYWQSVKRKIREELTPAASFSVPIAIFGGENLLAQNGNNVCFSPTCIKDFQNFVKNEYKNLSALNKEYGTAYNSWDQVRPFGASGNFPPWVDHRRHMESVWASAYRTQKEYAKAVLPAGKALCGDSSDDWIGSYFGNDYCKIMPELEVVNIYRKPWNFQMLKDFCRPGTLKGSWFGGYIDQRSKLFQEFQIWERLLEGQNIFTLYAAASYPEDYFVNFDLSPCSFFEKTIEEIKELKAGLGKLMINASPLNDGIGIYYSASSLHVATLTSPPGKGQENQGAYIQLVKDLGFQPRMVSYREAEQGKLKDMNLKVLILPLALALSPAEIAEIRNFVKNGGTVIADFFPGVYDQHGKKYENEALYDVFGVKSFKPGEKVKGPVRFSAAGLEDVKNEMTGAAMDQREITTAKPYGFIDKIPALLFNKYGRGQTVYLNFSLADYCIPTQDGLLGPLKDDKEYRERAFQRKIMYFLLRSARLVRPVGINPRIRCRTYRFRLGNAEYLGLLRPPPEKGIKYDLNQARPLTGKQVSLQLPRKSHVYDVRDKKYLGELQTLKTEIFPGTARLFALMPYEIKNVQLRPGSKNVRQGEILRYDLSLTYEPNDKKVVPHVFRVELVDPAGKTVYYYTRNIFADTETYSGKIKLALNEVPGTWTIKATEIVSGLGNEIKFKVLPKQN